MEAESLNLPKLYHVAKKNRVSLRFNFHLSFLGGFLASFARFHGNIYQSLQCPMQDTVLQISSVLMFLLYKGKCFIIAWDIIHCKGSGIRVCNVCSNISWYADVKKFFSFNVNYWSHPAV